MFLTFKSFRFWIALIAAVVSTAAAADRAAAAPPYPHYVYTNENTGYVSPPGTSTDNMVTTFGADATGKLTNLGQTSTGGTGGCDGFFAAKRNAKIVLHGADYLLAINNCSGDIAIFSGALTGTLVLQGNLSFAPALSGPSSVATNNTCVVVGLYSGEIDAYKGKGFIKVNAVTPSTFVDTLKIVRVAATGLSYVVTTDGAGKISITPLSKTCQLGTPNTFTGQGTSLASPAYPADVEASSNGAILYVADSNTTEVVVEAYAFPVGTPELGSPFIYTTAGANSNDIIAMGSCLFVANQYTPTGVTAIPLLSSKLPGPTATRYSAGQDSNGSPTGMAKDADGKSFYVAVFYDNVVTTELIGKKCALTEGPNSPLATGTSYGTGDLESITAVP